MKILTFEEWFKFAFDERFIDNESLQGIAKKAWGAALKYGAQKTPTNKERLPCYRCKKDTVNRIPVCAKCENVMLPI